MKMEMKERMVAFIKRLITAELNTITLNTIALNWIEKGDKLRETYTVFSDSKSTLKHLKNVTTHWIRSINVMHIKLVRYVE